MLELEIAIGRQDFRLDAKLRFDSMVSGLFGASGSGKTTLLHGIAGLVRPDRGRLVLDDEVMFDTGAGFFMPPHQRRIGVVFQDAQLFPHLSVRDNLMYGYHRRVAADRRFELSPIVDMLEIGHLLKRWPQGLSGGEKQRVALGRALLFSPRLLLLDEPLAALDDRLKRQISPFLRRIRDEIRIPMIYVSHALDEILYLTQYLAVMANGQARGPGHYLDVLGADPQTVVLPNDLGNVLKATVLENHADRGFSIARFGDQDLILPLASVAAGGTLTLGLKASQIALAQHAVSGTTIQNQFRGRIVRFIARQHGVLVQIAVHDAELVADISAPALENLALKPGDTVFCLIKTQAFDFLDGPEMRAL